MWLHKAAEFLLRKRTNAICVVLLLCVLPPIIASISAIILGLVTLRQGAKEGLILLLWALLPFLALAYVRHEWLVSFLPFLGFFGVWLFSALLRYVPSWRFILQVAAVLGVLAVLVAHLVFPNLVEFWAAHIYAYMQQYKGMVPEQSAAMLSKQEAMAFATIATGFQTAMYLIATISKVLMARWWQAVAYNPGGLRKELHVIRLSIGLLALGLALVVGIVLKSMVALDAIIPLLCVYVMAGLSLLHCVLKHFKFGFGLLLLFYLIVVIFPYAIAVTILMAMLDTLINFRDKIPQHS